ncbi:MBL fold metallo-hydrolase [Anaerotalea alkaliphila]|uniref:MBL fold metallo-hydrolase n=1 Tax=Anaerotalea alkaliphila TaxID=2662126 RepID=A0A7X5HVW8_9FIRM|nr:MBL fold metallo-hydrolase [Anaerotalea alkaliphila]NDL67599.1 MBL fold metallo-hydrolase [Anaerotalea alkaliphila]
MKVLKLVLGELQTNCYIAYDEETKKAVLVDAPAEAERIVENLASLGLDLQAVLLTHGHFDHVSAVPDLMRHLHPQVVAHKEEALVMEDPKQNLSLYFLGRELSAQADTLVEDGDVLDFGGELVFDCFVVEGHSKKDTCFYNRAQGVVFTGDTLMAGCMGRTDFYPGKANALKENIKGRLLLLPPETKVHAGHGFETTIGVEKRSNPYLNNNGW